MHAVMQRDGYCRCIQITSRFNLHGEEGGGPESQVTVQNYQIEYFIVSSVVLPATAQRMFY